MLDTLRVWTSINWLQNVTIFFLMLIYIPLQQTLLFYLFALQPVSYIQGHINSSKRFSDKSRPLLHNRCLWPYSVSFMCFYISGTVYCQDLMLSYSYSPSGCSIAICCFDSFSVSSLPPHWLSLQNLWISTPVVWSHLVFLICIYWFELCFYLPHVSLFFCPRCHYHQILLSNFFQNRCEHHR